MAADDRLSAFTIGTLCRIGIALSTCFWLPASLLLGLAGAFGELPGVADNAHWAIGFVTGFLQGLGCSILTDVILIVGAVLFSVSRRCSIGYDLVVRRR